MMRNRKTAGNKNTILLLHGDSFEDKSMYANEHTIVSDGNVEIVDDGRFNKGFKVTTAGLITLSGLMERMYSTGDFTIEWWERPLVVSVSTSDPAFLFTGTANYRGFLLCSASPTIATNHLWWKGVSGSQWIINGASLGFIRDISKFRHFCFIYSTTYNYMKFYVDGVNTYTQSNVNSFGIDKDEPWSLLYKYNAIVSEIRMSNIARWDRNFEPPTEPYK